MKEATHIQTKVKSAVKIINKKKLTPDDASGLKREIVILQELDHPNIMKLLDLFNEQLWIYMVTELVSAGELFDRIVQKECYNEKEARDVSRVMFGAIKYCREYFVFVIILSITFSFRFFSHEDMERLVQFLLKYRRQECCTS